MGNHRRGVGSKGVECRKLLAAPCQRRKGSLCPNHKEQREIETKAGHCIPRKEVHDLPQTIQV